MTDEEDDPKYPRLEALGESPLMIAVAIVAALAPLWIIASDHGISPDIPVVGVVMAGLLVAAVVVLWTDFDWPEALIGHLFYVWMVWFLFRWLTGFGGSGVRGRLWIILAELLVYVGAFFATMGLYYGDFDELLGTTED